MRIYEQIQEADAVIIETLKFMNNMLETRNLKEYPAIIARLRQGLPSAVTQYLKGELCPKCKQLAMYFNESAHSMGEWHCINCGNTSLHVRT